jgi:hypothetical protein
MSRSVVVPHLRLDRLLIVQITDSVPSGEKALPIRSPFASKHCLSWTGCVGSRETSVGFPPVGKIDPQSYDGGQTFDPLGYTLKDSSWCRPAADHAPGSQEGVVEVEEASS